MKHINESCVNVKFRQFDTTMCVCDHDMFYLLFGVDDLRAAAHWPCSFAA